MHKNRSAGILISYAGIIVNMVSGLVLSAFLLRTLGDVEYGIYQSVFAFAGYLILLEFGTGTVMARNISVCLNAENEADRKEMLDRNYSTIWVISLILSCAMILVGGVFYWTLDKIYQRIVSGNFWSDDPDDYFDILAWHPYVFTNEDVPDADLFLNVDEPDQLWKSFNDAAYKVMKKYGDGHKQAILTEAGFTDLGDPVLEERYAEYNKKLLQIASELPYVRTLHNFRLLNENAMLKRGGIEENQIGGLTEVYFGIFTDPEEGLKPRKRAYAIREMTCSTADLDEVCREL